MKAKQSLGSRIRGWFPKESNLLPAKLNVNAEEKNFQFNKRFYAGLAVSYALFVVLVVVPFLLGYIDATMLGYGLAGIAYSLGLMVMVRLLNDHPELRKRAAYVVCGVWLGLAVGVVGGMLLFGHQLIAAIGSLGLAILMLAVLPSAGGFIGYWMQKRKFNSATTEGLEEL